MRALRVLSLLIFGLAGCRAEGDRTGYVVLPGMHYSVPAEAFDQHPEFGKVLRSAPEGTIPMGYERVATEPGAAGLDAAKGLRNPVAASDADTGRAQKLYGTFCEVCHGAKGEGDGPIIGRFPNPPSLLADRAKSLSDGQVFHIITHGQGLMASYATQVRQADRWLIVHHVRSLQGLIAAEVTATETSTPAADLIEPSAEQAPEAPEVPADANPDAPSPEPAEGEQP